LPQKDCYLLKKSSNNLIEIHNSIDMFPNLKSILKDGHLKKRFTTIYKLIFRNETTRDSYEEYSDYKGTGVFKLTKGKGRASTNYRIYCKVEYIEDDKKRKVKKIVLMQLHNKKNQELSKKERTILAKIQNTDINYEEY